MIDLLFTLGCMNVELYRLITLHPHHLTVSYLIHTYQRFHRAMIPIPVFFFFFFLFNLLDLRLLERSWSSTGWCFWLGAYV